MSEEVSVQHSLLERKQQYCLEQYDEIPYTGEEIRSYNGGGTCTTIKAHNFCSELLVPTVTHEEVQLGYVFFDSVILKYILKPGVAVLFTGIVILDETCSPEKDSRKDMLPGKAFALCLIVRSWFKPGFGYLRIFSQRLVFGVNLLFFGVFYTFLLVWVQGSIDPYFHQQPV